MLFKMAFGISCRAGLETHVRTDRTSTGGQPIQKVRAAGLAALLSIAASPLGAEGNAITLPLNDASSVRPRNVTVEAVRYGGSDALEVRLTGPYRGPDMDTFAYVPGLNFHDGTIEVDVAGSPLPTAPSGARGFVGVAFRIDENGGSFSCEGLYIRPTNGRAQDQVRRNRSTQYFSYPGYDFDRLRREAPGQYEFVCRPRARRMDPSADRGVWCKRSAIHRRFCAACAYCARSEARPGCAWDSGNIRRQRHRWSLPQPIYPPTIASASMRVREKGTRTAES